MRVNPVNELTMLFNPNHDPLNGRIWVTVTAGTVVGVDAIDEENTNVTIKPTKATIISGFATEQEVDIVDISVDAKGRKSWLVRKSDGKHMLVFDFSDDDSVATWAEFPM